MSGNIYLGLLQRQSQAFFGGIEAMFQMASCSFKSAAPAVDLSQFNLRHQKGHVFSTFDSGELRIPRFWAIKNPDQPISAVQFLETFLVFVAVLEKEFVHENLIPLILVRNKKGGNRIFCDRPPEQVEWMRKNLPESFQKAPFAKITDCTAQGARKALIELWDIPLKNEKKDGWVVNALVVSIPGSQSNTSQLANQLFRTGKARVINLLYSNLFKKLELSSEKSLTQWLPGVFYELTIADQDVFPLVEQLGKIFPPGWQCDMLSNDPRFMDAAGDKLRDFILSTQIVT